MNDEREPTKFEPGDVLDDFRDSRLKANAERETIAHEAALELLLPRRDQTIYFRDGADGKVEVKRQTDGSRQIVVKSCSGRLGGLTEGEIRSLTEIFFKSIEQVISFDSIASDPLGLRNSGMTIKMPYVGLDLSKWECLLYRDHQHNPFLRVGFHLKLATSMLTALEKFHTAGFLHCDIKLNNWCVVGKFPDLPRAVSEGRAVLAGKMNLSELTLIDLGCAMTSVREFPKDKSGTLLGVRGGNYRAPSYIEALGAADSGDMSLLKELSWKSDLFSLGKLFEDLVGRYCAPLAVDSVASNAQKEFLRTLPGRLCKYEEGGESLPNTLPHRALCVEIAGIADGSLDEYFQVMANASELDEVARSHAVESNAATLEGGHLFVGPEESQTDESARLGGDVPESQPPGPRRVKSIAALAAIVAGLLVAWLLLGEKPPAPMVLSRADPVFAKCDALRVNAIAGESPNRQDYSMAIGRCSEFLELKNAPPELRFDALITRAVALEKSDRWHEALEDLKLAEAINPTNPGVDLNRSLVLSRQGKSQQAFASLDAAIDKGWRDGPLIERDTDYDAITKSPSYQSIRIRLSTPK